MIEWNRVTWYSKLGAVILFIGVVPVLTFRIGMIYQETKDFLKTAAEYEGQLSGIDNVDPIPDAFDYTVNTSYANTKHALQIKGWATFVPTGSVSAGDASYPEIGDCGSGIDAICNVNFKRGHMVRHLNVQIGGRQEYTEWMVVGGE